MFAARRGPPGEAPKAGGRVTRSFRDCYLGALGAGLVFLVPSTAVFAAPACPVGERVLAEPGDRLGVVIATTGASCRVHFDDPSRPDDWVQIYSIKDAGAKALNMATAAAGPSMGRYNITVGNGFYDGYFVLNSPTTYELFLSGGGSAGAGEYAFDPSGPRIRWLSGPMTDAAWDGTQTLEAAGNMMKIRIGTRSVATNTKR